MGRNADFERLMKINETEHTAMSIKSPIDTNTSDREVKSVPKERPAKISPQRGLPYRSLNRANVRGLIHREMVT